MNRLYCVAPSLDSTSKISEELNQLGTTESHIHVVTSDHKGLKRAHLLEAGLIQTTDLKKSLERGILYGAIVGLLAGLFVMAFPPGGIELALWSVLVFGVGGAALGAWSSSMIGISIPDEGVEKFEKAVESGQFLMIVDIPKEKEAKVAEIIRRHHPEAIIQAFDLPNK